MNGSTSAKKTDDGLAVRCACEATFTLPATGGERRCECGRVHRYDGRQLVSTTPAPCRRGPATIDPRAQKPPRGETRPL